MKKILVVFDTSFGNTERIGREIAAGISESGTIECEVMSQEDLENLDFSQYDGYLFGGPVHAFRAARGIRKATEKVCKAGIDGKPVAAFDTYQAASHKFKGTETIEKIVRKKAKGARLITPGMSALVLGREGPLADGEIEAAQEFGRKYAQEISI